jgi:lipopolysaccharide export system protein LptA
VKRRLVLACALCICLGAPLVVWAQAAAPRAPAGAAPPSGAKKPASGAPDTKAVAPDKKGDDKSSPVTVDADALENLQKEGLIIFTGNVVANQANSTQYADRMEVYLDDKGASIVRTVSTGRVRIITKDCRTGTAARVEYYDAEQRVVLIGNARVWRDDNVVTGERITIYLAEDRSIVEGGKQDRVKAVFFPKSNDQQKAGGGPAAPGPCG